MGYARLYSAITGGPAAKYDKHLLDEGCSKKSKALKLAKNPRKNTRRKKVQIGGSLEALGISQKTLQNHLTNCMQQLMQQNNMAVIE